MKELFYDWGGLNVRLFHLGNDIRGDILDRAMWFGGVMGLGGWFPVYAGVLAAIAAWIRKKAPIEDVEERLALVRRWETAIAVFSVASLLCLLAMAASKAVFGYPRPLSVLPAGSVHVIGKPLRANAFPSGHSAFVMTLAASVWPVCNRRWRAGLAAFVLWVGLSRVSVGAHFPADVLGGYAVGLLLVLCARAACNAWLRRKA